MTRTIFAANIAAAAITTAAAAIESTNAPRTMPASPEGVFSVDANGLRDCNAQTWPNIDPTCLKDIEGMPANREFRAVAL